MVLLFANGLFFSFFPFWQPGHCEPPSHWCLNTMPGTHQRLCFVNTNVLFSFFLLSFAAGYFLFFFVFSVPPAWHLYRSSVILVLTLPLRSHHPPRGTIQMEKSILSRYALSVYVFIVFTARYTFINYIHVKIKINFLHIMSNIFASVTFLLKHVFNIFYDFYR